MWAQKDSKRIISIIENIRANVVQPLINSHLEKWHPEWDLIKPTPELKKV